jgi:hypothetical protein
MLCLIRLVPVRSWWHVWQPSSTGRVVLQSRFLILDGGNLPPHLSKSLLPIQTSAMCNKRPLADQVLGVVVVAWWALQGRSNMPASRALISLLLNSQPYNRPPHKYVKAKANNKMKTWQLLWVMREIQGWATSTQYCKSTRTAFNITDKKHQNIHHGITRGQKAHVR